MPENSLELLYTSITKFNSDASVGSIEVEYDVHQEYKESNLAYYTVRKNCVYAVTDEIID